MDWQQYFPNLVAAANSRLLSMGEAPLSSDDRNYVYDSINDLMAINPNTPFTVLTVLRILYPNGLPIPEIAEGGRLHMSLSHRGKC
jgi:hypothetical protein